MNRIFSISLSLVFLKLISCGSPQEVRVEFQEIPFSSEVSSSLPVLSSDGDRLVFSWVSKVNDSTASLSYTFLDGELWAEPKVISSGSDWFVNWADFPAIVQNKGNLLSHILQKSSSATFSYDIQLNVLPSGSTSWKTGLPLHVDSTFTEHGFVSSIAYSDSSYFVSWLDGRETGGGGHDHSGHSGAMSIRAAEVSLDGRVLWDELLDAKTCDCCQTSSAMTALGPVVLYRNRSDREIRDIAIMRLVNGKWTEPRIIHADGWEIAGCPVNGPKVAAQGNTLLVGWFTAPNQVPQVKFAFSTDSGASFGEPVVVEGTGVIGRVDVALLNEQSGIVSWMETIDGTTYLQSARFDSNGKLGVARQIATMDPSRKSGFPQMELHQNSLYFAWTEVSENGTRVRTAVIPLEGFN
jgi:hypothetical protein